MKESSQMFLASVSYNFSFGRKFKAGQRRVNNSDNDSGVMSNRKINKIIHFNELKLWGK